MTSVVLSLTDAGLAAVQGASGADPVQIAELGLTATPFDMAPTLTALPGEFKRIAAVSGTAAAPNITHMSAYDTSDDVWNATGLGLWLADGTLFATFSADSTIINKAAPAFALISFDIIWQADLAASIVFGDPIFTNPPATTEMRGLIELATQAEADAGTDGLRALTPATAFGAVLGWLLAQDGAGSGLDADLLDGQSGAWYADVVARLGFAPLPAASYTAADVLAKLLTVDGAGSGLDADLLDGHSSAAFRRVTESSLVEQGGYIVHADGLKETWGFVNIPANSYATYNVPVTHTSWINPVAGLGVRGGSGNTEENIGIASVSLSAVTLWNAEEVTLRAYVQTKGV